MQKKCDMFGGEHGEQMNVLMDALDSASERAGYDNLYDFLNNTARTSLVTHVHDALCDMGYEIRKNI